MQFVGQSIHLIDYLESKNQPLSYYVNELRSRGYQYGKCYLPHDGIAANAVTGLRYRDHLAEAGFADIEVIKNQGKGAAMQRIEAAHRLFPKMYFDEERCAAGLECLGAYHPNKDDARDVDLGPEHDWASHAADAFGLMAITYEDPRLTANFRRQINYPRLGIA